MECYCNFELLGSFLLNPVHGQLHCKSSVNHIFDNQDVLPAKVELIYYFDSLQLSTRLHAFIRFYLYEMAN